MRITRFLHNRRVTTDEMMASAYARTSARAAGRQVLAIQDTTSLRLDEQGVGLSLHPVLAVDAADGAVLGLIDAVFLRHEGGARGTQKSRPFEEKESRRWLDGARSASRLLAAGAASVTVVEDREGDVYEVFASRPEGVSMLVRAAQDRRLSGGGLLFETGQAWPEAGRMTVALAAAPGRKPRQAVIGVRYGEVEIERPANRGSASELAASLRLSLVVAEEIDPPKGLAPASWFLLATEKVQTLADATRTIGLYRMRWVIEQLFRTIKTKGFDVEALRQTPGGPLEKLTAAILVAGVSVMQLVAERDGAASRPSSDVLEAGDQAVLERICRSLEGDTAKQKNPHPPGSLAYAAWVFARLGGWTGYYGKPGHVVILRGITQFQAIKLGMNLRDV